MRRVEVGGATLALREWGAPEGPLVLFWHSLGPAASGALAVEAGERLARRGWHVVAPDGPGFGASEQLPAERYAVRELARADALVLLDSGHIDYADLMPQDAGRSVEDWIEEPRARAPQWESFAVLAEEMKEGSSRWSPALEAALRAGLAEAGDGGVKPAASPEARGAALWGLASTRASEAWPVVAEAAIPVLLLLATKPPQGEQNRASVSRFQEALPRATASWVPDASHSLLVDAGPPLADGIANWLEEGVTLRSRR